MDSASRLDSDETNCAVVEQDIAAAAFHVQCVARESRYREQDYFGIAFGVDGLIGLNVHGLGFRSLAGPVDDHLVVQLQLASSRIILGSDGRTVAAIESERYETVRGGLTRVACKMNSGTVDAQQAACGRLVRRHAHDDVDFAVRVERLGVDVEFRLGGTNQVRFFAVLVEELQFYSLQFGKGRFFDFADIAGANRELLLVALENGVLPI